MVGLTMPLFSEKMLNFNKRKRGLMPNLIKKSWTISITYIERVILRLLARRDPEEHVKLKIRKHLF